MLPLLHWLDLHPQAYLWGVGGFFSVLTFLTARSFLREKAEAVSRGPDWAWTLVWGGALLVGRWPTFLIPLGFNSDESQLVAGAHALAHDPVFWRATNGGTAGPLDFVALWPAGWCCGWDSHLAARITAWLLLTLMFAAMHECLARLYDKRLARVVLLPAVAVESLTNSVDLLHYSTELLPLTLLAWATYAAVRRWTETDRVTRWSGLGGVLLGAVPFAKLQAAPLAALFGLGWLVAELRQAGFRLSRPGIHLLAGALLPGALIAFQLTVAGEWNNFFSSYLLFNLQYAAEGVLSPGPLLLEAWRRSVEEDSLLPLWLAGSALGLGLLLRWRGEHRDGRRFALAAAAGVLVAFASILRAGRPFLHYWQLLVPPWTLLVGAVAGNFVGNTAAATSRRRWLVVAGALGLTAALLLHRTTHRNFFQGAFVYYHEHPRSELAEKIRIRAQRGDTLVVWGICTRLYVETGLVQGAHEAHFWPVVASGPLQGFFRRRFLEDVVRGKPAFFVDATGSDGLAYHAPAYAHDVNFPPLARFIHDRYDLVETIGGARLYQRRDLVAR